MNDRLETALKRLRKELTLLFEQLKISQSHGMTAWTEAMDRNLLPRLSAGFPLMAAVCGGGSSGKSTLFNTLVGERLSPTGGLAGMNRRVLIAAHDAWASSDKLAMALSKPFQEPPGVYTDSQDLLTPGPALCATAGSIPPHLVLMDTPDFDTGARGDYVNRDAARMALEASDFLIYIFTNANYNNRDNTDFIADMLNGIGARKCFFVYRVYPAFQADEVLEHAMTVANNIYGSKANDYILGIYRADEDNAVAAGEKFLDLNPVHDGEPALLDAIGQIDRKQLRLELLQSVLEDVLIQAETLVHIGKSAKEELALYLDALEMVQQQCVQAALKHVPLDRVMKRFADIWIKTDPPFVKAMRKTGRIIDAPIRGLLKTMKWAKRQFSEESPAPPSPLPMDNIEADIIRAASKLHAQCAGPSVAVSLAHQNPVARRMGNRLSGLSSGAGAVFPKKVFSEKEGIDTFTIPVPPALKRAQEALWEKDWESILSAILANKDIFLSFSKRIDDELLALANHFRSKMGEWDRIRQSFSAFLNVVPATVAVTYILSTGDPVGAVGIKVKLTGLFGLHDLYALVALPATSGIREADQKQLEQFIGPIVNAWIGSKVDQVQQLFEENITDNLMPTARDLLSRAESLSSNISEDIIVIRKESGL